MRRRAFSAGGAAAVTGLTALAGCADPSPNPSATTTPVPVSDDQMAATIAKLRAQYNAQFDPDYVEHAVLPWYLNTLSDGARPVLPMIDVALTKENALPYDLWGLLSETWKPAPEEGVTVFLQGLEKRGPDNRRKRIYMSAVTPDLYQGMYQQTIVDFFDGFQPLM